MNKLKNIRNKMALLIGLIMVLGTMPAVVFAVPQGQGTLKVSNAMKGQTYMAYKIFNAVYADPTAAGGDSAVVYTVPADKEEFVTAPFSLSTTVASNGEKIVSAAEGTPDADIIQWAKDNYSKFDGSGNELVYKISDGMASAELDYGYYYVTSGLGSMVTIDSLNKNATIVDKNESQPVGPEKVISAEESSVVSSLNQTNTKLENNEAAVGSKETFSVTFQATNWIESEESDSSAGTGTGEKIRVTSWQFTDNPTGLNIDPETVKITVNGEWIYRNGRSYDPTNITTVSGGGSDPLVINIPWVNNKNASLYETYTQGSGLIPVVITYDATVTSAAATAIAPNSVEVKYNNETSIGTDATNTYTYKFKLDKVKNETNNYDLLPGAQFQLYASDGTTLLKFDLNGTTYTFNPEGSVETIDMTTNPEVLIQGLDLADYVLKETKAPAGYNKAADQTITSDKLVRVDGTIEDPAGIDNDKGVISVINETGRELPSTGGIGTTIFYCVGTILVLGAGVVLVTRRRMVE